MGAVNTTYTFTATDTITSTKMNNIIDQTTMTDEAISGSTLEVTSSGRLKVRALGITSNEIANGQVTSDKILDSNVTAAKLASTLDLSGKTITFANSSIPPSSLSQPLTLGSSVSATGTSIDFASIPAWAKNITVMIAGISSNGTSSFLLQLGDADGIEASGYNGGISRIGQAGAEVTAWSNGAIWHNNVLAASNHNSTISVCLISPASNTWMISGVGMASTAIANGVLFSGSKSLSSTLDRLRITTVNGTDTFDAGTINIMYQ